MRGRHVTQTPMNGGEAAQGIFRQGTSGVWKFAKSTNMHCLNCLNCLMLWFPCQACPEELEEIRGCNESPCGGRHCQALGLG